MKPHSLNIGDKVAIVSLSSGALGENFAKHELDLGLKRLEELELVPVIMPNALKGMKFLSEHPEARAQDLVDAFADKSIKGIICAIGGNDTYRLIPHILGNKKAVETIKANPKVFVGYSDSTINHLMLGSLGLNTFYGQAFLTDLAELDEDMLPYSKFWFLNLFLNQKDIELKASELWYEERRDFSPAALGTAREKHLEDLGFVSLCAGGRVEGELFGGCVDSINTIFEPENKEQKEIFAKYHILPENNEGKVLFLETSDEKMEPDKFRHVIKNLKEHKFFDGVQGVLFGKPQDQAYLQEYMNIVREELAGKRVLFNLNFGHAFPHCIMPYGARVSVDYDSATVHFVSEWFSERKI